MGEKAGEKSGEIAGRDPYPRQRVSGESRGKGSRLKLKGQNDWMIG